MTDNPGDTESRPCVARSSPRPAPTAVNLRWAIERMRVLLLALDDGIARRSGVERGRRIADEDVEINRSIGEHGSRILASLQQQVGRTLNVLTHCNAGWLATVDRGTALAPVYQSHDAQLPVHVWVSENPPAQPGLAHRLGVARARRRAHVHRPTTQPVICFQRGKGRRRDRRRRSRHRARRRVQQDRHLLKALAGTRSRRPVLRRDAGPTIDWTIDDGCAGIPIEERGGD
jgi:methylthioribose-1-phosphate isomerase